MSGSSWILLILDIMLCSVIHTGVEEGECQVYQSSLKSSDYYSLKMFAIEFLDVVETWNDNKPQIQIVVSFYIVSQFLC